jgi:acyl-coenzyme A thioesterase PaaI-like protein
MKSSPTDGHVLTTSYSDAVGNQCFGCGPGNRYGLRLRFTADEETRTVACRVRLPRRFEGPPGHAHGGIVATILDEAMGKVNKLYGLIALTRRMEIDYLRPVPLRVPLLISGRAAEVASDGRKHFRVAEIRSEAGELLATSTGLFIEIDPHAMFAKHIASRSSAAKL